MPAVNMIIENATLLNTAGKYCDKDIVVVPVVQPDNVRVTLEITLKATEWVDNKQIVESATITEDSTLVVSHTMADVQAYLDSGIMLASAEVGKMEFTCVVVPTEDIKVLVHIIDPLISVDGLEERVEELERTDDDINTELQTLERNMPKILSFDNVEEMNAYEAEDGAIAIVPSEGGDGLEVVEIMTYIQNGATLTSDESAQLTEKWNTATPITIKLNTLNLGTMELTDVVCVPIRGIMQSNGGMISFAISFGAIVVIIFTTASEMMMGTPTWQVAFQIVSGA